MQSEQGVTSIMASLNNTLDEQDDNGSGDADDYSAMFEIGMRYHGNIESPRTKSDGELYRSDNHEPVETNTLSAQSSGKWEFNFDRSDSYESMDDKSNLDNIPVELFLHICSFIDARYILLHLSPVCKAFYEILNDPASWKIRVSRRWPYHYPAVPVSDEEFNWKYACMKREDKANLWSDVDKNLHHVVLTHSFITALDAVNLCQKARILTAASRDGYLHVWDISKLRQGHTPKESYLLNKNVAERSWLWSLASKDNILATGAWDSKVRFYDMEDNFAQSSLVRCNSAVLCLQYLDDENSLVAGGYNKQVYFIDKRSRDPTARLKLHKKPVLTCSFDGKYAITGSEDRMINIYDRTAGKVFKSIELQYFPMSMSYNFNQLWVGDKRGGVHLLDAREGAYNIVQSYPNVHTTKTTGIQYTVGALFTCSTDETLMVHHPTLDPVIITSVKTETTAIAGLHTLDDVTAVAGSNGKVNLWYPKDR